MRPLILAALLTISCRNIPSPPPSPLSSFRVDVAGLYLGTGTNRVPLPVVSVCAAKFGGQQSVPVADRGTRACPYAIARGTIEIDIAATALDIKGEPAIAFTGPVSFRVVPGDLVGGYEGRFAVATAGVVTATIRTHHQYGSTRVWAEDAPPQPIYSDGGMVRLPDGGLPPEPARRTYATGLSQQLFFEEPTLAKVQIPDGFDNRSSPLVGEFLSIGKNPESGERLLQSCTFDPQRDNQPALMVITGTDPSGFFVTDVSACRQIELTDAGGLDAPRTAEPKDPCLVPLTGGGSQLIEQWDGGGGTGEPARCKTSNEVCTVTAGCRSYLPGTYGSMFIYNYSFPDGLDEGDLLWTLSGSVQEFTSTTQMTFPSWSIAEKVRRLPPEQWNKWLQYAPPVEINNRTCGAENVLQPFLTDQLCGHSRRNLKMESLESGLVKMPKVRFPTDFTNCDANADFSVPFFCDTRPEATWIWGSCSFAPSPPEPPADTVERVCNSDCVIGTGPWQGKICSERTTHVGFGQFVVEMNPPGAASFGFDESVSNRVQHFAVSGTAARPALGYAAGVDAHVGCDVEVRLAFGPAGVIATATDLPLAANAVLKHVFTGAETTVSVLSPGGAPGKCWIAQNFHNRMNLVTKDALPELQPDCRLDDPDPAKAKQCQYTRGATFDVIGHLRHLQPGRPRWAILPRDPDDVCCYPDPGLECPRPVKPCP